MNIERQEELMCKLQDGSITDSEIQELRDDFNIVVDNTEETPTEADIPYSLDVIASHEQFSTFDTDKYNEGVKQASKYLGALHTLINGGVSSQDSIVVASWIYNMELTQNTLKGNVEALKVQSVQVQQQQI